MVIITGTCYSTTFCWVSISCYFITIQAEVSNQSSLFAYFETIFSICRYYFSVFCPVYKCISCISCSSQCRSFKVIVCTGTCYSTTSSWIYSSSYFITIQFKVCYIVFGFCYGKTICCICWYFNITFCPVYKGVSFISCGCQSSCLSVGVCSVSCYSTAVCRICTYRNAIWGIYAYSDFFALRTTFRISYC